MKAKVTWKGEEGNDQKELKWQNRTFKKDEALEIDDEALIRKLQGNRFFEVDVTDDKTGEPASPVQPAPSNTASPQHPASKPGEPMPPHPAPLGGGATGKGPSWFERQPTSSVLSVPDSLSSLSMRPRSISGWTRCCCSCRWTPFARWRTMSSSPANGSTRSPVCWPTCAPLMPARCSCPMSKHTTRPLCVDSHHTDRTMRFWRWSTTDGCDRFSDLLRPWVAPAGVLRPADQCLRREVRSRGSRSDPVAAQRRIDLRRKWFRSTHERISN